MSKANTYLFAFQMKQDGELSFLGDHGAFLDGKVLIDPIPSDSMIDVIVIAVTITNKESNAAQIELAQATRYPISKEGKPLMLYNEVASLPLSDFEKIAYTKKAASILSEN